MGNDGLLMVVGGHPDAEDFIHARLGATTTQCKAELRGGGIETRAGDGGDAELAGGRGEAEKQRGGKGGRSGGRRGRRNTRGVSGALDFRKRRCCHERDVFVMHPLLRVGSSNAVHPGALE